MTKNKRIILVVVIILLVIIGIVFNQNCKKIEGYNGEKAYEDLSYVEKTVAKVKGYTIYTRQELRDNEASKIVSILKKIGDLNKLYDINNRNIIDEELARYDKVLEELHKENSSGKIYDDSLRIIIDNSIGAVENRRNGLDAFKNGNLNTYSEFTKKSEENISEVRNEMERLGFTK